MIIRKLFKAEMAHNVPGAYTKRCHYLHGHSYKFELYLTSNTPNEAHMVADFKAIKEMGINDFFDSFDHAVTIWEQDPLVDFIARINPERHMIVPFIPTAEMLAKACFVVAHAILETGPKLSGEKNVEVNKVIVHETDTGAGIYSVGDIAQDQFPKIEFARWQFSAGIKNSWARPAWYSEVINALK